MMKLSILTFIICCFSVLPNLSAVNKSIKENVGLNTTSSNVLTVKEFTKNSDKSRKLLQHKKMKWNQRIALKIFKKKVKKHSVISPTAEDDFNINDLSFISGIIGLTSLLLSIAIPFFAALYFFASLLALITGLIGLSKDKPRKKRARLGMIMGAVGVGLILIAFLTYFAA